MREAKGKATLMDLRKRDCEFDMKRDNKALFNIYQKIDESMLKNAAR